MLMLGIDDVRLTTRCPFLGCSRTADGVQRRAIKPDDVRCRANCLQCAVNERADVVYTAVISVVRVVNITQFVPAVGLDLGSALVR
jgi:hypothetical protein